MVSVFRGKRVADRVRQRNAAKFFRRERPSDTREQRESRGKKGEEIGEQHETHDLTLIN